MKYLTIKNKNDADGISPTLHDAWFDVEKINFDAEKKIISVSFAYKQKSLKEGLCDVILSIENVERYEIDDTEQIGFYDLNKLEWDADKKNLKFICNMPLHLKLFFQS